jgi:hypothetical protein
VADHLSNAVFTALRCSQRLLVLNHFSVVHYTRNGCSRTIAGPSNLAERFPVKQEVAGFQ